MNALEITTGVELERFDLGDVKIAGRFWPVLTGHEFANSEGKLTCLWCGERLSGRQRRYCTGHREVYWALFEWASAKRDALKASGRRCANCGERERDLPGVPWGYDSLRSPLEIHHIVPVLGRREMFSAWHLPWNLIVLCHWCHVELHAAMRPPGRIRPTRSDTALAAGQIAFTLPDRCPT